MKPKLALMAALALPGVARAQDAETITVTGYGLSPAPGDATLATVTIDHDRLSATPAARIEDLLGDVAGIAQFRRSDSRSAHPTSQGITLRGLGGNAASRALLILDGVPQADPFGGWVPFPAYLPARLARIRVTRGGGGGLNGPGALAGTVELESGSPDDLGALGLHAAYGSRDSVDTAGVGAVRLGSGFATVAAQYARGDGFVPVVAEDRGPVDHAAPYDQVSLSLRGVADLGRDTELQANLGGFVDRRDRGVDFTRIDSRGSDASLRLVGRGRWGWSALAYLQARMFSSGFASVNAARTTATPALDQYRVPSTGMGGRFEIAPPIGGGVTLRTGVDWRGVSGRTQERYIFTGTVPSRQRRAGGSSATAGGFADVAIETGPLTLTAGGRIDHWTIRDGYRIEQNIAGGMPSADVRTPDRDGWEPTGRIGAAMEATRDIRLRMAAYRDWRLPTLNELYRPYRVGADSTAANAGLRPEHLTGAEIGVDVGTAQGFGAGATLFWNRLDDAIANVTLAVAPSGAVSRERRNVDSLEAKGAEFDLRWRSGAWGLSASYAYTDARMHGSGQAAALDGLRPAQVARHQASATASWRRGDHQAAFTARYAGPQFDDDLNRNRLAHAFTVDANAALPLAPGLMLDARAENLFDTRVEAGISGADVVERAAPRTLWVGMRYRIR